MEVGATFWRTDKVQAVDAWLRACDLGDYLGYRRAGTSFITGYGGAERNVPRGFQLLVRACDNGECTSCLKLAELYKRDKEVPADPRSAAEYHSRGAHCLP